jgi:hypothetical protein
VLLACALASSIANWTPSSVPCPKVVEPSPVSGMLTAISIALSAGDWAKAGNSSAKNSKMSERSRKPLCRRALATRKKEGKCRIGLA